MIYFEKERNEHAEKNLYDPLCCDAGCFLSVDGSCRKECCSRAECRTRRPHPGCILLRHRYHQGRRGETGRGADPEEPYTDADLNYNDSKSRTSIETDDPGCRPAIAGELPDLTGYDTVLIGYPIWWGDVPRIVSNFVENVDLTDKTLAVFFTSGSSGLGSSMKHLEEQAAAGTWLEGKRFTPRSTVEELLAWTASLGIKP